MTDPEEIAFSRKEIFDLVKKNLSDDNTVLYVIIQAAISKKNAQTKLSDSDKCNLTKLLYKMRMKFKESCRKYDRFIATNESWLSEDVILCKKAKVVMEVGETSGAACSSGRPAASFEDASDRTKRRRTESLRDNHTTAELAYATHMSYREAGNLDAAKVIKDIAEGSPTKASRYRKSLENVCEKSMSAEAALSLVIENRMSRKAYTNIRNSSIEYNCKLYPSYHRVLKSKELCYPCKDDITITECSAAVNLQALLDHTTERILQLQKEVVNCIPIENITHFELICKWGCDGTSGQSTFKQTFSDDDGSKTDANIFFTSIVPLRLAYLDQSTKKEIIVWKNPRPSSTRFCRPIKIEFLHETAEATRNEVDRVKEQEQNLQPLQSIVGGKEVTVVYKLALTMIDGKVCNSITNTSSAQKCYLCNSTSKDFNDIDKMLLKEINDDNLQYGISTLHAWIRFFECLLHISYRLDVKKWQSRGVDKESIESRKKLIQKGFRVQLGLIVDQPKQGYGSTNDGNTARRFFENSNISSKITGIDENLIDRFHVILQVISCGFEINVKKYQEYCLETARLFVQLYPWFYMPTTVHKLLIHSAKVVEASLLPIGQMSEEAQESCNKLIKKYRQDFARKTSRIATMQDVFLRLMASSDPLISSIRKLPQKKLKCLPSAAINLLNAPACDATNLEHSMTSSEEESEFSSDEDNE